jgi:hypothetical protein
MGFFFRKSVGFGPFRLNLSKSGIGISTGVRGARISTGSRGTYINVGRHGFYYRQKVKVPQASAYSRIHNLEVGHPPASGEDQVVTNQLEALVDTSCDATIAEINTRLQQTAWAPILTVTLVILVVAILISICVLLTQFSGGSGDDSRTIYALVTLGSVLPILLAGGIPLIKRTRASDKLRRTTELFYELDQATRARDDVKVRALESLAQSSRIWNQQAEQATGDWKRNAGANALITRKPIGLGRYDSPGIVTNVPVWAFDFGYMKLFFLPDQIFVLRERRYGAFSYDAIQTSLSQVSFREEGPVPTDSQIIDYTWKYVNKRGGPDRRFKNNFQIPIVRYAELDLKFSTGPHIKLHVSRFQSAVDFINLWNQAFSKAFSSLGDSPEESKAPPVTIEQAFDHETPRALHLALKEQPKGWEFLLTAELLRTRLALTRARLGELQLQVSSKGTASLSEADFLTWISSAIETMKIQTQEFKIAFEERLFSAWSPSGKLGDDGKIHGDPIRIKRAVERITACCNVLVDLQEQLRSITLPPTFARLKELMKDLLADHLGSLISECERFVEKLTASFEEVTRITESFSNDEHRREGPVRPTFNFDFSLELSVNEKAHDDFNAELAAIQDRLAREGVNQATKKQRGKASKSVPSRGAANPYEVLGVQEYSTAEEVTTAYRKMAGMYHPDKVESLAPEYREIASQKMREINAAYDA